MQRDYDDAVFDRWANWGRIFFIFFPSILLVPVWRELMDYIGLEGAFGLVSIIQIACIAIFPDRIAMWAAKRKFRK
jgi:hypothetical protein